MNKKHFVYAATGTILLLSGYLYYSYFMTSDCQLTTPNLIGLNINDARFFSESRGYKINIRHTVVDSHNKGEIITQSPQPGTKNCDMISVVVNK